MFFRTFVVYRQLCTVYQPKPGYFAFHCASACFRVGATPECVGHSLCQPHLQRSWKELTVFIRSYTPSSVWIWLILPSAAISGFNLFTWRCPMGHKYTSVESFKLQCVLPDKEISIRCRRLSISQQDSDHTYLAGNPICPYDVFTLAYQCPDRRTRFCYQQCTYPTHHARVHQNSWNCLQTTHHLIRSKFSKGRALFLHQCGVPLMMIQLNGD